MLLAIRNSINIHLQPFLPLPCAVLTFPFFIAHPRYTYTGYKNQSDKWELIEGYPYSLMPSAKRKHPDFASNFIGLTKNILFQKSCKCKVYSAFDCIVNDETITTPDCMIVCGEFFEAYVTIALTLIVKIGSASTYLKDKNSRYKLYELQGVKHYLMADTEQIGIGIFSY